MAILIWIIFLTLASQIQKVCCLTVNVHLITHTHLDPMWRSTPSEYQDVVNKILASSVLAMVVDSNRTFSWESTYFMNSFLNTYGHQSCTCDSSKKPFNNAFSKCLTFQQAIQLLLDRDQLEFVGGGYTAQDEALSDFFASLDDLSLGRRYIAKTFGER
jgi:hypothetical protein